MLLQTVNLVPLIAPLTLKDNTANLAFREEEKAEGGWWMVWDLVGGWMADTAGEMKNKAKLSLNWF